MNYKEINSTLRRGIKTIIESYEDIESNDNSIEDGIYELIEDIACNREDVMVSFDLICGKFFEKFGFQSKKAHIIYKKIENLNFEDEFNTDYLIELIKEFDRIASCVSQLSQYPDDITNTIRELAKLESHESMDSDALKCIFYVLSFYNGWFLGDGIVMREVLENEGFDYDEFGLISPEEHESIATKGYNLDLFFDVHGELEEKPEIYGCSVTVKFSNGKQYKYNCKNDEVEEDDVVCVSGKLMNQQGTVIDRSEIWNSAEYMEEVTAIVEEETESGEEDDKEDNDKSFFGSLFGNTVNGKK